MLQIYIFTSCTNIGLFHNSESWSQLIDKNTFGSPIREIATLRRRFMPPLYFPTSLSATPPANKRTLLKDCSIACKQQIEVVSVSPLYRFCNKITLVFTSQNTKMTQKFLSILVSSGQLSPKLEAVYGIDWMKSSGWQWWKWNSSHPCEEKCQNKQAPVHKSPQLMLCPLIS